MASITSTSNLLEQRNDFTGEFVPSAYGYFSGYTKPVNVTQQVIRLQELFPEIGGADERLAERPLPVGAEGYFAIPRWERFAPTYGEAVQIVCKKLEQVNGKFHNMLERKLGPQHLRQQDKTAAAFRALGVAQSDYDMLVVPAQFGITYRGRSGRSALQMMDPFEFGLGVFAGGIMLLTHENRLPHVNDLLIDLPGDESSPDANGSFGSAPYFSFGFGAITVDNKELNYFAQAFGSASGFVPQ